MYDLRSISPGADKALDFDQLARLDAEVLVRTVDVDAPG
jgi:hypothetical protein